MYTYLIAVLVLLSLYIMYRNKGPDIKKMVKQCAKFATTAQQDASLLTSMTHANYAMGYLLTLKDVASPAEIHRQTGVDFKKFEEHINNVQEMMNQRALKKYPGIEGETDFYLSSIASSA
jgi:hypothetical protein